MAFWLVVGAVALAIIYRKKARAQCRCVVDMEGKVVIITGANSGIGKHVAMSMARRGARVILGCRNTAKGLAAEEEIRAATDNTDVEYVQVDFESLDSVRRFAHHILNNESRIDVLVNNAGALVFRDELTIDGLSKDAQVNYYAHFLLTMTLLPLIKVTIPSRIINVSSPLQIFSKLNPATLARPARGLMTRCRAHANIKLAMVLFTKHLARQLVGTGTVVNCGYPGATYTGLFRGTNRLWRILAMICFKTPAEGAQNCIHMCVAPELANLTGKYFVDCRDATASTRPAYNQRLAAQLWAHSETRVELAYPFNYM